MKEASPTGGGVRLSRSAGTKPNCGSAETGEIRAYLPSRQARDHLVALEDVNSSCQKRRPSGIEHVRTHVITVGPDAGLWIIDKVGRVGDEVVEVIFAGRILRRGNGDALMRKQPSLPPTTNWERIQRPDKNIVRDNRIAIVMGGAIAAESLKERVARRRSIKQRAGVFVEDGKAGVIPHHILCAADSAIDVQADYSMERIPQAPLQLQGRRGRWAPAPSCHAGCVLPDSIGPAP